MKYFLTIDKGLFYNKKERFKKINLSSINESLDKENNLEAICTFTTAFETPALIKDFLNKKKLLDSKEMIFDLVITYQNEPEHLLDVAYASDKEYFNLNKLEQLIYSFSRKPERLRIITKYYNNQKSLTNELTSLRAYLSNPFADYKLFDVIRRFIEKVCYKTVNGKRVKNYQEIYRLGMLLRKLDNPKRSEEINKSEEVENISKMRYTEEDPEYFHFEELQDRKNHPKLF